MCMKLYVDRLEGDEVVCVNETCNIFRIRRFEVEGEIVEGSVLIKNEDGKFVVDFNETKLKRAKMADLQNEIFFDDD